MSEQDGIIKDSALPPLKRVLSSSEGRVAITGEVLGVRMLSSQVAIRGMFLAKSTANAEMSALRAFLHGLASGTADLNRDEVMSDFEWLNGISASDLSEAIKRSSAPPSEYGAIAGEHAKAFRSGVRGRSLDGLSDEELLRQVSGVRKESPVKVKNRNNTSFMWNDYVTIMMDLAEYDPESAVKDFLETGRFSPGIARIIIATMYLTGCRPIEVFGINVYAPRTDMRYTEEKRGICESSPISAIYEDLLSPIEESVKVSGAGRGQHMVRASRMTGIPCVLSILSAKQQNANKDLRFPVRFQILTDIQQSDANLLGWAAELRKADKSDAARRRVSTQVLAILRKICASNPEMRQDITLNTFRHSFASRARAYLDENECSALTGHTAVRTFRGYGEHAPKRRGSGWMPVPDPERAKMIDAIWNGLVISPEDMVIQNEVATDMEQDTLVLPAQEQHEPEVASDGNEVSSQEEAYEPEPDNGVSIQIIDPDTGEEVSII